MNPRSPNTLVELEEWYLVRCNGDWEHQSGISIETLDNPGWLVKINLNGTPAETRNLERVEIDRTERDWIHYWVEKCQFNAACGPLNLSEAIETFINWFEGESSAKQESR